MRRRPSLRLRLTLSYGVLFFVIGFLLLALSYLLLRQVAIKNPGELANHTAQELLLSQAYLRQHINAPGGGQQSIGSFLRQIQDQTISEVLRALIGVTFWALAAATAVSVVAGWWMAGRMLRPVQEISAVARRLSASTLHERINLSGPQGRARTARRDLRRHARPPRGGLQRPARVRLERLTRLRTPLAIMRTELDVTLADPATDAAELRRMAGTIRDAISRSEDVIDRLLVLAETDDLSERSVVDLAGVVRRGRGQPCASRRRTRAQHPRRRAAGHGARRRGAPRAPRGQPRRQCRALRLCAECDGDRRWPWRRVTG